MERDMEMWVCKNHLHARYAIASLIECANKQNIQLDISSYETFFEYITQNCPKVDDTYIAWECCPDKKTVCNNITANWHSLKEKLLEEEDS